MLLGGGLGIWLFYLWAVRCWIFPSSLEEGGHFGDLFGGANALFAAFGFAGLIYTILLQREQLISQEEELRRTREAVDTQIAISRQQTFENSFFQLTSRLSEIAANMTFYDHKGRKCFGEMYGVLKNDYHDVSLHEKGLLPAAIAAYHKFFDRNQDSCGYYFRMLYNIFKFIKNSNIADKKFYSNLVRAQLSSSELLVLFYNCASPYGEKFKPLVEEFGILKGLDKTKLIDQQHQTFYQDSAFL